MSNVGYDLDTSGGLMPLIRALIKPPDEDLNAQKPKKPQHPYYKRPGKGHNHDSCDACGEGGDLICCDRCPASFHLGCYDPPLDENDIPAGQWLCKECRGNEADKPASSRSSRAQSPADAKSDTEKKTRSLRNNRANSSAKKKCKEESKEREDEEEKKVEEKKEEEKELTPMEILVKAAKIMNPKQFDLPREMRIPCPFPGTDKEGVKNSGASLVSVDAWGCVPLPARTCFVCTGTCKHAPLLQCDYCPLLFHQDCLDPPLTALPTGRWMCPNHVEQYIDWKLVNSISATERVALWDKFSGPVDQHAIKIDFIRQARKARPAFRMKVPVGIRGRVLVPEMVRYHYANPPPLMPSRREYVRCNNVLKNLKAGGKCPLSDEEEGEGEGEAAGPKHAICLNAACPQYRGAACPLRGASPRDAAHDLRAIRQHQPQPQPQVERSSGSSSELSESDLEYLTSPVKRRRVCGAKSPGERKRPGGERRGLRRGAAHADAAHDAARDADADALLAAVDHQLDKLDHTLVRILAWQRLQQVLVGEQCVGAWRRAPLSRACEAQVLRGVDRARLQRHGFRHVPLPSELLTRDERARIARAVWGAPPARTPPPPAAHTPPASPGHSLSDAPVRATLCPVTRPARHGLGDGLGRPVPMRLSRVSVGSDSGCDVPLDRTRCANVSRLHATIFCDEVTGHFELINYSEWGSRVNGVLYACDVARAQPPERGDGDGEGEGAGERVAALRDLVRRRMPTHTPRLNGDLMSPSAEEAGCRCPPGGAVGGAGAAGGAAGAWEGSALVPHGALLQFGCLMYVFSITDAHAFPYEAHPHHPPL